VNILCVADGSDDGYESASLFARIVDPRQVSKITIILIAWPPRKSVIWSKANDAWLQEDDLHEAVEVVIERELERYRSAFAGHAESIEATSTDGDPVVRVIECAGEMHADMILLAITRDEPEIEQSASEIVAKSPIPVFVA